jgi:hypothetical protein
MYLVGMVKYLVKTIDKTLTHVEIKFARFSLIFQQTFAFFLCLET